MLNVFLKAKKIINDGALLVFFFNNNKFHYFSKIYKLEPSALLSFKTCDSTQGSLNAD